MGFPEGRDSHRALANFPIRAAHTPCPPEVGAGAATVVGSVLMELMAGWNLAPLLLGRPGVLLGKVGPLGKGGRLTRGAVEDPGHVLPPQAPGRSVPGWVGTPALGRALPPSVTS